MLKLCEYFWIDCDVLLKRNETVHVHGKFQGRESRAELILVGGAVEEIIYSSVAGRAPLAANEM